MKVDFETGEYREYINADEYNAGWNELATSRSNFFKYKNNTPKFAELFMNTIIAIGKDTVSPYLTINHKDWVREGDFLPFNEYTARQIFIFGDLAKRGRAITIYNYFEWQDIIFFQYMNVTAPLSVVYNKKTKELHQYKYLKNDMLFENRCRSARLTHVNAKAAYEYFSTEDFPVHYDAKDHLVSNLDLSVYLDKREEIIKLREESFMIFEYEFK
jgi:hypothetical protein